MPDTQQIFKLRKEGKLEEALAQSRQLFAEIPLDPWLIRAYGWTLHDTLKTTQGPNTAEIIRGLFAEFEALQIPKEEGRLTDAREFWRAKIPRADGVASLGALLESAKQTSEAGNRREAIAKFREALQAYRDVKQASMALGWEIQRVLKDILAQDPIDGIAVRELLQEYARIPHIEKPGLLHSLILGRAAHAATKDKFPTFIRFLKWWDPVNLQKDDFERFTPEGSDKPMDCRVELVIRAVHKASDAEQDTTILLWAADFMAQHYEKFPDQEWFSYYYGQLLVRTGDLPNARNLIIPIVRRKQNEFWSWHALAGTCSQEQQDTAFSCLCRSLLCPVQDESYLVKVHAEMGALCVARGLMNAAKYEIERVVQIRTSKGWKISPQIAELQRKQGYSEAVANNSNRELYEKNADLAEALIFEGLPDTICVVRQINHEKNVTVLALNKDDVCLLYHDRFPAAKSLKPGDVLAVKTRKDETQDKIFALTFTTTDKEPSSDFYRRFKGTLDVRPGQPFGFVTDNAVRMFVPPDLINVGNLVTRSAVSGTAIFSFDRSKENYGWRAVSVCRAD